MFLSKQGQRRGYLWSAINVGVQVMVLPDDILICLSNIKTILLWTENQIIANLNGLSMSQKSRFCAMSEENYIFAIWADSAFYPTLAMIMMAIMMVVRAKKGSATAHLGIQALSAPTLATVPVQHSGTKHPSHPPLSVSGEQTHKVQICNCFLGQWKLKPNSIKDLWPQI